MNQAEIRALMKDPVAQKADRRAGPPAKITDFENRLPSYVDELITAQ
jgi:hypothetical protein